MRIRMRLPIKSWLEKCQVRGECSARGTSSLVRRDFEAPPRLVRTGTVTALNADPTSRAWTDARLSPRLGEFLASIGSGIRSATMVIRDRSQVTLPDLLSAAFLINPRIDAMGQQGKMNRQECHGTFLYIRPSFMMTLKFLAGSAIRLIFSSGLPSTSSRSASAPCSTTPSLPG
jgi:hypothetical protein